MKRSVTYRRKFFTLLWLVAFSITAVYASSEQTMYGLTALSLGGSLGNTAPAIAFNPKSSEYLVLYVKNDAACGKERLFARVINATTGGSVGTDIPISECNNTISEPRILYNTELDEFIIFFKSIGSTTPRSRLLYSILDGQNHTILQPETLVDSNSIGDPFRGLELSQDYRNKIYALSYHKINASNESALTIKYVDTDTRAIKAYQTGVSKSDFGSSNEGLFGTRLVFNGNHLMLVFELRQLTGSEIWGILVNPVNGMPVNEFFRLSPQGASDKYYINPAVVLNAESNEVILAYEESQETDPDGAYRLSKNINLRKANASSGALLGTSDIQLPALPVVSNFDEDKKLPALAISRLSQELIISYYGIRWVAGEDRYNLYLHRYNLSSLSSIDITSVNIAAAVGTEVQQNESLKKIGCIHNDTNNQFGMVWLKDSNKEVVTQVWRYNNNPPSNLRIATSSRDENMPVGSTFTIISADDPDPEDALPLYSLVSGAGSADNHFFSIENNNLKIARNLNYEETPTRSVRIRATDSHAAFTERNFILTINDINEAPYAIQLSGELSVEENSLDFSSTITIKDEDAGDMHSIAFVQGDSSDNNSNFQIINGNTLQLKNTLNYEDTSIHYIRLRATDLKGLFLEKAFAIVVIDVNEPMEDMYLSPTSIPENDTDAFVNVVIVDPDAEQNYNLSLTEGEGDDDNTSFTIVDMKLKVNQALDFEKKNVYNVRIKATEGNYVVSKAFVIQVLDMNDAPDSIRLTSNKVMDGRGAGYAIGKIITYDQDEGDGHNLSLLVGADLFTIDTNDSLITKIPLVYNYTNPAANFYNISIQSEDEAGAVITWNTHIEVIPFSDTEAPQILNFSNNPKYVLSDTDQDFTLSVNAIDNEKMDTIYFYYRKIRSEQPFIASDKMKQIKDNDKFFRAEITLNTSQMDEMGIEYYFMAVDASGNQESTPVGQTYRSFQTREFSPTGIAYNGELGSYKIIANPYQSTTPNRISKIFSDYGTSSDKTWRLFSYDGGNNIEVGTSTSALMNQGDAFWFNKMPILNQAVFLEIVQTPANHQENEAMIQLEKGWNLIGNPYPFTLDWSTVLNYNGFTSGQLPLYTFDQQYSESATLEIFEGGFVYVLSETTLTIPIINNSSSSGRIAAVDDQEYEWKVDFRLENKEIKNTVSGLGMHQDARTGLDGFDRPELPRFISFADIIFEQTGHVFDGLSRDFTAISEEHIWDFAVSSNSRDRRFTLSWEIPAIDTKSKRLFLYDVGREMVTDMTQVTNYSLDLSNPMAFKVIYGDQKFIESTISGMRIVVPTPYPNPFNSSATISILLPESITEYEVNCNIYNLLGERVFDLTESGMKAGAHEIEWHPHDALLRGVYIYSIKIKNEFLTKEFHGRIVKN